ncbi:glycosyltransferase [Bradyrhizobium commune]|uniref:Glycosyltransferase n=1 Tax=Bradyrhizobium commune TaxID=83627 RepID=A0A7S9GZ56_9BRAD|nr:glycosyltransferase [Bradyrhizobium commune]QPF90280.1 glycosyltransferase [Bradyrhizobium commune]
MKSLIITPTYPPMEGRDVHAIYKRLRMFVHTLSEMSDCVTMLHFVEPGAPELEQDSRQLDHAQSDYWGTSVRVKLVVKRKQPIPWWQHLRSPFSILSRPRFFPYVGDDQVAAIVSELEERPDLVLAHRITAIAPLFRIKHNDVPVFFDLDDVEHKVKIRSSLASGTMLSKLFNLIQVPGIYFGERKAASIAELTFVCSELDRRYLDRLGWREKVQSIPNALPIPQNVASQPPTAPVVLFLGNYEYPPNAMAAERLISNIWPRIINARPTACLTIAGNRPDLIPAYHRQVAGVEYTGVVDDLGRLYQRSRVICCPISIAGGTRVKLVEAAGYAKPMVSTAIGAEGLGMTDNVEILIRDSDDGIADACSQLIDDAELCARLGSAAREKAMATYDVVHAKRKIRDLIAQRVPGRS